MTGRQGRFVGLLRGINVGGRRKVSMAQLRAVCVSIGCGSVRTYIQSGNVVFAIDAAAAAVERQLEPAIERRFGFSVPVIVRSASRWRSYVEANPFVDEATREGSRVLLALAKDAPVASAASALEQHATLGERVLRTGDAIWIHYAGGIARSKLAPALLDRCVGSAVTARNWRTVLKLNEMLAETST